MKGRRSLHASLAAASLILSTWPALGQEAATQALRERLTEREDENRVEDPLTIQLFGRPLSLSGQYEVTLEFIDRLSLGDSNDPYGLLFFAQEIEAEAFYNISPWLSFFTQVRFVAAEDLNSKNPDGFSGAYVERGEMWLYAGKFEGEGLSLEVGRLNFEDDRRWWWDEELDAVRVGYEAGEFSIAVAVARELAPSRSDMDFIEPVDDDVLRLIAEVTWDWSRDHAIELFALYHNDQSATESPGEIVWREQEDESDGEFLWAGLRAAGAGKIKGWGALGYWFDAAFVVGDERLLTTEELSTERNRVEDVTSAKVRGWGFDVGATWILPAPAEPRLTIGYALGSGDPNADDGTDRAFRQTGLQANEPGFGGVQSFASYGLLLYPELSNISILTLGIGCSIFESSSVDLVFHDYRLVEPAESLRDAGIDVTFTGQDRAVGQGIDLVVAIEEWERVELEFAVSAFRSGAAFGDGKGDWDFGGFVQLRFAF